MMYVSTEPQSIQSGLAPTCAKQPCHTLKTCNKNSGQGPFLFFGVILFSLPILRKELKESVKKNEKAETLLKIIAL